MIMNNESELEQTFVPVTIDDIDILNKYLLKAGYEEGNHNIVTMFIWIKVYPLYKYEGDNYLLLQGKYDGKFFLYMPLCEKQYFDEAILKAKEIFDKNNQVFIMSCFNREMMEKAVKLFPEYKVKELRDIYDYIYSNEALKSFSGKKLQKKRNHLNAFYKEYEGRYVYEKLNSANILECVEIINNWKSDEDDFYIIEEKKGIKYIFSLFDKLQYSGGIIRIDGNVEGFIIGSYASRRMVQINVEKANNKYRGIYQALLQQFLIHEFNEVELVNREDDLGLENLRQAKLAYNPLYMIEKYQIERGDLE